MADRKLTSRDSVPMRIFSGVLNQWTISFLTDAGQPIDLTGYTYHCDIREFSGGPKIASLDFDLANLATGVLGLSLSMASSEAIGTKRGFYDILQRETATPTNTQRVYGGEVELLPIYTEIA